MPASASTSRAVPPGRAAAHDRRHIVSRGLPDRRTRTGSTRSRAARGYRFEGRTACRLGRGRACPRMLPIPDARRIVLVDGRLDTGLSDFPAVEGLEVIDLGSMLERDPEAALALLRARAMKRMTASRSWRMPSLRTASRPRRAGHRASRSALPGSRRERGGGGCPPGPRVALSVIARSDACGAFHRTRHRGSLGNLAGEIAVGRGAESCMCGLHEHAPAAARSRPDRHSGPAGGTTAPARARWADVPSDLRLSLEVPAATCRLAGLFMTDGSARRIYTRRSSIGAPRR